MDHQVLAPAGGDIEALDAFAGSFSDRGEVGAFSAYARQRSAPGCCALLGSVKRAAKWKYLFQAGVDV
jgi:hypothetical protein